MRVKQRIKRVFVVVLTAALVICQAPEAAELLSGGIYSGYEAYADEGVIGTITVDEETISFTDLGDLVDYVKDDLKGETFTIDMEADWGDKRLVIESRSRCTLNMHGHMFNRGRSSYKNDGEVICIHDYARLTINGGTGSENDTLHTGITTYYIENDKTSYKDVKTRKMDFYGGLIAGGYSSNGGGGIDITGTGVTLNLNDVTIAGCRAVQTWGTDGYGGGIWMHGGTLNGGTINMNHSSIVWCYATNDGGGIYQSNHDFFTLSMKNGSHIDNNAAGDDGGGICVDGESLVIKGDNSEITTPENENTISNNSCGDYGGGIHLWNDDVAVKGLTVSGNYAGDHGGGIYTLEEGIALTNLKVQDNRADDKGGGIYIYNDGNSISGCTITGNYAGSKGGGVYIEDYVDSSCYVAGKTIVRDNWSAKENPDNLKIEDDTDNVNFDLAKGSDVHVTWDEKGDLGNSMKVSETKGPNCIRFMTSDVPGYHFTFNADPDSRKIYIVKDGKDSSSTGEPYVKGTPEPVDPVSTGTAGSGKTITGLSGKEYPVTYGYLRHADTDSQVGGNAEDKTVRFYYSDGFFDADPFTYDQHLATASLSMAMAGGYLNDGGTGRDADYSFKHSAGRQFMSDIGCDDKDIYVGALNLTRPGTDTMGVTIASKEIETGSGSFTLIPVVTRSIGYEGEWASNVLIGTGETRNGEAQGFSDAAEIVMGELNTYISRHGLEEKVQNGEAAFWITGFSRGAATANLAAKRIREKYQNAKLFAYTFATPKGGSNNATSLPDEQYFCIHNVLNAADLVPHVAMGYMGFVRYGVDHYVPGGEAGEVKRVETAINANASGSFNVTDKIVTYSDNEPYRTKTGEYNSLRDSRMADQLKMVDSALVWDDYFRSAYINTNIALLIYGSDFIKENGSYKDYAAEDFMNAVMRSLERYAAPSRDDYALHPVKFGTTSYDTYQKALRDVMVIVFGTESDTTGKMMDKLDKIVYTALYSSWSDLWGLYDDVLGEWGQRSGSDKKYYSTVLWDLLDDTGVFDVLDEGDRNNIRNDWPALMDLIFNIVDGDYNHRLVAGKDHMELSGTFAYNGTRVLYNHYPEVYLAWVRAVDSFYDEENTEYALNTNVAVGVPAATTTDSAAVISADAAEDGSSAQAEIREISTDSENPTRIYDHGTIWLDVPDNRGETIYYTLHNRSLDWTSDKKVYNGGIDLYMSDSVSTGTNYEITAEARSYNSWGDAATFYVKLFNGNHKVSIDYSSIGEEDSTLYYREGESTLILAKPGNGLAFEGWTAWDDQGRDITELVFGSGDASDARKKVAMLSLPTPDEENGLSEYYEITLTPKYTDQINTIQINGIAAPQTGQELTTEASLVLKKGNSDEGAVTLENVPVTWTYEYDFPDDPNGKVEVLTGGQAYGGELTYRATLHVSMPEDAGLDFAEKLTGIIGDGGAAATSGSEDRIGCRKNKLDGSATIVIVYPPTSQDGGAAYPSVEDMAVIGITPWDTTFGTAAGDYEKLYYADPRTASGVQISAPDLEDREFNGWEEESLPEGAEISATNADTLLFGQLSKGEYHIQANYIPLVKYITAQFYKPAGGRSPENAGFSYMTYELNGVNYQIGEDQGSDNTTVDVVWTPAPSYSGNSFDYDTEYSAILNIVPDENGNITIARAGYSQEKQTIKAAFAYADDLVFEVYESQPTGGNSEMTRTGLLDPVSGAHYISFDRTAPRVYTFQYYNAEDIQDIYNVEYTRSGLEDVLWGLLPAETRVTITPRNSGISSAPIEWTDLSLTEGPEDGSADSVWTATGKIQLPEHIQIANGASTDVSIRIYVDREASAAAPAASLPSGSFMTAQSTTLESETPGAVILYTMDGSDPLENGTEYTPGQSIDLSLDTEGAAEEDGKMVVTLRTIAVKEGLADSAESVYKYTFTNEIEIPETVGTTYNSQPQIIVEDSEFFDLSVESGSAELDADGNVLATEAGEYKIRAKIKKGYRWRIPAEGGSDQSLKDEAVQIPENKKGADAVRAAGSIADLSAAGEDTFTTQDQIITAVITPANLETLHTAVKLEKDSYGYTGKEIEPEVSFARILGEGADPEAEEADEAEIIYELVPGTDFEVTYEDNINENEDEDVPKAKTVVTGRGNFCGSVIEEFTIYGLDGPDDPYDLVLFKDRLELAVNQSEKLLTNSTGIKLIWTSDNETVATVGEDGTVTAHKYGRATITVTTEGGASSASCQVQTLFWDVAGSPDQNEQNYQYYFNPVYWAAEKGITRGYNLEYFGVDMDCERQDFTLFLYRLDGQPAPDSQVLANLNKTFSDVSGLGSSFRNAIAWAYGNGIIKGYTSGPNKGKFGNKLPITRREAMIMLWRYAGKPAPSSGGIQSARSFTDVKGVYKESSDSFKAIAWAAGAGIANGYTKAGSLPPGSGLKVPCYGCDLPCKREQMITFLYRYGK